MAKFNHFRIFIAVLAAFGAFFAFICRYNLSLVIEEMVIKQRNTSDQELGPDMAEISPLGLPVDQVARQQTAPGSGSNPGEPVMAPLSSGRPRWIEKMLTEEELPLYQKNTKTRQRRSMAPENIDETPPVEFDLVKLDRAQGNQRQSEGQQKQQQQQQKQQEQQQQPQKLQQREQQPESTKSKEENDDAEGGQKSQVDSDKVNWPEASKNNLLGAYFWTYAICQIPAGRAAEIFGAKTLIMVMGLGTSLSTLLFPYAAHWTDGILSAYVLRLVLGACQAGMFPALYVLLCEWLPKTERSTWLAVPSAMGRIGTIAMNLIVPFILVHFNWRAVFLISGCVTLLWSLLFFVFGSDSPATSKWLSNRELLHIESRMEPRVGTLSHSSQLSLNNRGGTLQQQQQQQQQQYAFGFNSSGQQRSSSLSISSPPPPLSSSPSSSIDWFKVVTNRAVLVLTLVMFSSDWSNMLLLTKLPGFLSSAMRMDVAEIGIWTSLLVTVYCIQYPLSGIVASRLELANIRGLSSLNLRKLFEALAHALQAAGCLMIALFSGKTLVLVALFVIMLGRSTTGGGQCQMPPEISKEFPGTVMALANSGASFAGVIGPVMLNWMVAKADDYDSWRNMWLLSAGLFVVAGLIFVLLADNEPQDFAKRLHSSSQAQLVLPPYIPPAFAESMEVASGRPKTTTLGAGGGGSNPSRHGRRGQNSRAAPRRAAINKETLSGMDAFSRVSDEPSRSEWDGADKARQRSPSLTRQI